MSNTPEVPANSVWRGIGWGISLPIAVLTVFGLLEGTTGHGPQITNFNYVLAGTIGLTQWAWIVPMMRKARNEGRNEFARGLKIGAWIVFVPYAVVAGGLGSVWILLHINLNPGAPWFNMGGP